MVYTIDEIKRISVPIAKEYGVNSLSLFGSYARCEANEDSDIDFFFRTHISYYVLNMQ